jgi:hypothetical protein
MVKIKHTYSTEISRNGNELPTYSITLGSTSDSDWVVLTHQPSASWEGNWYFQHSQRFKALRELVKLKHGDIEHYLQKNELQWLK